MLKRHLRLLLAVFSAFALFFGTASIAVADQEHCPDSGTESRGHRDCKPQNNPRPENPPCDADHGHPAQNSPRCEEEPPPPPPPPPPGEACTAEGGDPGLITDDTLGQTAYDNGLSALEPLVENPQANGVISGPVHEFGEGEDYEVLTDEVACAVDLPLHEGTFPADL